MNSALPLLYTKSRFQPHHESLSNRPYNGAQSNRSTQGAPSHRPTRKAPLDQRRPPHYNPQRNIALRQATKPNQEIKAANINADSRTPSFLQNRNGPLCVRHKKLPASTQLPIPSRLPAPLHSELSVVGNKIKLLHRDSQQATHPHLNQKHSPANNLPRNFVKSWTDAFQAPAENNTGASESQHNVTGEKYSRFPASPPNEQPSDTCHQFRKLSEATPTYLQKNKIDEFVIEDKKRTSTPSPTHSSNSLISTDSDSGSTDDTVSTGSSCSISGSPVEPEKTVSRVTEPEDASFTKASSIIELFVIKKKLVTLNKNLEEKMKELDELESDKSDVSEKTTPNQEIEAIKKNIEALKTKQKKLTLKKLDIKKIQIFKKHQEKKAEFYQNLEPRDWKELAVLLNLIGVKSFDHFKAGSPEANAFFEFYKFLSENIGNYLTLEKLSDFNEIEKMKSALLSKNHAYSTKDGEQYKEEINKLIVGFQSKFHDFKAFVTQLRTEPIKTLEENETNIKGILGYTTALLSFGAVLELMIGTCGALWASLSSGGIGFKAAFIAGASSTSKTGIFKITSNLGLVSAKVTAGVSGGYFSKKWIDSTFFNIEKNQEAFKLRSLRSIIKHDVQEIPPDDQQKIITKFKYDLKSAPYKSDVLRIIHQHTFNPPSDMESNPPSDMESNPPSDMERDSITSLDDIIQSLTTKKTPESEFEIKKLNERICIEAIARTFESYENNTISEDDPIRSFFNERDISNPDTKITNFERIKDKLDYNIRLRDSVVPLHSKKLEGPLVALSILATMCLDSHSAKAI